MDHKIMAASSVIQGAVLQITAPSVSSALGEAPPPPVESDEKPNPRAKKATPKKVAAPGRLMRLR